MYLDIHLQGGVYLIYTPPIEQSDWLECYNHGTRSYHPSHPTQWYLRIMDILGAGFLSFVERLSLSQRF